MATSLSMYSGDSRTLTIAIHDQAGAPVDVSDAVGITYGIFDRSGTALVTKMLGAGLGVVGNVVTVTLDPLDTADMTAGDYVHELEVTRADGRVATPLQGTLRLLRDFIL